ncbi:MAG TPA: hypothetical protein PKN95_05170 [Verrucomicrobiota bacterium]|nr:hypothetical protein [Verrucomicrobiota bacterium]HNT15159.1 hypothetical protein [Verrucomicrobiota bacterium]
MNIIKLACISLLPVSVLAQGTIVDSVNRNGSFEDSVVAPWSGLNQLFNDPLFASDGVWVGVVQSSIRTDTGQSISVNPVSGRTFLLSFDARVAPMDLIRHRVS